MIEDLARASGREVSRETFEKLELFVTLLMEANQTQNLVAKSASVDNLWHRHVLDSAQLLRFAAPRKRWVDIGSGAGLPGLVLAILSREPTTLVEPRALRASFLAETSRQLGLDNVHVEQKSARALHGTYDVITARAVATAVDLFGLTLHLAHADTLFIFPKGRSATSELEVATRTWQGNFRLEPSVTSDEASILIASHVKPRGKG